MNHYVNIRSVRFDLLDFNQINSIFCQCIEQKKPHQVCVANVHTLVECIHDEELRNITNSADIVTMDGQPIRWYTSIVCGVAAKERITGADLMERSIQIGLEKEWRHFFLGSTEEVLRDLENRLSEKYNGVRIVGMHSPPFRQLTKEEDDALVNMINNAKPDFLWVALGYLNRKNGFMSTLTGSMYPFKSESVQPSIFMQGKSNVHQSLCRDWGWNGYTVSTVTLNCGKDTSQPTRYSCTYSSVTSSRFDYWGKNYNNNKSFQTIKSAFSILQLEY